MNRKLKETLGSKLCKSDIAWAKSLLNEVSFNVPTPHIYGDNLGSLFWGSNPIQKKYSKHIDICYHYIRDLIENKQVKPYHIDKKENPADILTKALAKFYSVISAHLLAWRYSELTHLCFYHLTAEASSKGECCEALRLVST